MVPNRDQDNGELGEGVGFQRLSVKKWQEKACKERRVRHERSVKIGAR